MSESSTPDFHPTNFFPLRYEKDLELMVFENHKKVSFNIASEASYVYFLSGQNGQFGEFLKKPEASGLTVLPNRSVF